MSKVAIGNPSTRSPVRLVELMAAAHRARAFGPGALDGPAVATAIGQAVIAARLADATKGKPNVLGQKIRTQMVKFGLVYAALRGDAPQIGEWNRRTGELTPIGRAAIAALGDETSMAQVMTAIMGAYRDPVPTDLRDDARRLPVWPLRHILRSLVELERLTGSSWFSEAPDLQICLQLSGGLSPAEVAEAVVAMRMRLAEEGGALLREAVAAADASGLSASTLRDYADTTLRHIECTGLISASAGGWILNTDRRGDIEALCIEEDVELPDLEHMRKVEVGWAPPAGAQVAWPDDMPLCWRLPAVERRRFALRDGEGEAALAEWVAGRRHLLPDLAMAFRGVARRQNHIALPSGGALNIPGGFTEGFAVYAEYLCWWLGCAVFDVVDPYASRGLYLGRDDLLPIVCAPPGRADCLFESPDWALITEATMLTTSRQDAAEGVSVRKHVAVEGRHARPTIGLFVAPSIDLNTADSFLLGRYFLGGAAKSADVVPLTMNQVADMCEWLVTAPDRAGALRGLLSACLAVRTENAAIWLSAIQAEVMAFCSVPPVTAIIRHQPHAHVPAPAPAPISIQATNTVVAPAVRRVRRRGACANNPSQYALDL